MSLISAENLIKQLNWRYAVKQFDTSKKLSESDWHTLSQALRLTPSSFGLQPWNFVLVQNPDLRKKLTPVSWNQAQIESCSHLVVFTSLKKVEMRHIDAFIETIAARRGQDLSALNDYKAMMVGSLIQNPSTNTGHWSQKQTYLALGNLLTTCAILEIDACPMEGIDSAAYDKILDLENSDYTAIAVAALGYRSSQDSYQNLKKVRFSLPQIIKNRL